MDEKLLFLSAFLEKPREIGSVIPSSRFLVKELLKSVDFKNAKCIVEYGPGTGRVTKEILKRARKECKVLSFEINRKMYLHLRKSVNDKRLIFTVTWLRWILALIVAFSLVFERRNIALLMFILTSFVGFTENFISKKYPSLLRSVIDFFADKMLVNFTLLVLVIKGIVPAWVFLIIFARDLLTIIIGTMLLYKGLRSEFKPTMLGKISYFFQLMALIQPVISNQIDWYLMGTALSLTIISGAYSLWKSEFKLLRKKKEADDFRMLSLIKLADLFTLFNVALGLVSIVFSMNNNFRYAAFLLLVAVAFDYLDGTIAVSLNQQNVFGKELDSLADTVSFGVAPAIFGFSLMQYSANIKQLQVTFGIVAFTIFLLCGILRLARYSIMDMKGVYRGMPITLNGILIPAAYFADVPIRFYPYIYLVLGVLMVSSIKVKKLG